MNTSQNSNIYEFDAASALASCDGFVEGTPNCTLAVIAERSLNPEARNALTNSAERLGFGRDGAFWIVCEREDGTMLDPDALRRLLVACDPLAFIAADVAAVTLLERAFDAPCGLDTAGRLQGRNLVTFADFQNMLAAPEQKQRAWALLKKLPRP